MSKDKHPITDALLDQLLANYQKPEDLIGADGILKQLTKKLVERALDAEMTHHLGHDRHQPVTNPVGNTRNGFSRKKLKGEFGELPIEVPRDRHGSFEPQIVEKHQTRWVGFDDKILSPCGVPSCPNSSSFECPPRPFAVIGSAFPPSIVHDCCTRGN